MVFWAPITVSSLVAPVSFLVSASRPSVGEVLVVDVVELVPIKSSVVVLPAIVETVEVATGVVVSAVAVPEVDEVEVGQEASGFSASQGVVVVLDDTAGDDAEVDISCGLVVDEVGVVVDKPADVAEQ